jgi:hypothetical protein
MRTRPCEHSVHSLNRGWNAIVHAVAKVNVRRMSGLMEAARHAG